MGVGETFEPHEDPGVDHAAVGERDGFDEVVGVKVWVEDTDVWYRRSCQDGGLDKDGETMGDALKSGACTAVVEWVWK